MKKFASLLTIAIFALTTCFVQAAPRNTAAKTIASYQKGNISYTVQPIQVAAGYSCTVTASWTNDDGTKSSVEITVNCGDCTTRQAACDKAYKVASIVIPG